MPLTNLPGSWPETAGFALSPVLATNRTGSALTVGGVYAFDLTGSDGDVDPYATDPLDPFANVIACATAHLKGWIFCVALEATANDEVGRFVVRGVVDVLCKESTAVAIGDQIMPQNASAAVTKLTDGLAAVGFALEAGPTGGSAAVASCWFDGYVKGAAGAASA